jgi:hypothetical protein
VPVWHFIFSKKKPGGYQVSSIKNNQQNLAATIHAMQLLAVVCFIYPIEIHWVFGFD